MRAVGVPPDKIQKAWPLVARWIRTALERGKGNTTLQQVLEALPIGRMQLWLAWDRGRAKGCCVTELFDGARGKTCNLVVVAGDEFEAWLPLTDHIKAFAKSHDCVRLEATGRSGWERRVAADGWKKINTTIEMAL